MKRSALVLEGCLRAPRGGATSRTTWLADGMPFRFFGTCVAIVSAVAVQLAAYSTTSRSSLFLTTSRRIAVNSVHALRWAMGVGSAVAVVS